MTPPLDRRAALKAGAAAALGFSPIVLPLLTDKRGRPPVRVSADSPAGHNVDKVTVDGDEIKHGILADEIDGYVEYFVSIEIDHPQFLVTARRTGYVVVTFKDA